MRRALGALFATLALAASACSSDASVLEETYRFPSDEGIATDVTLERIELDGERVYAINENVESFTTRSRAVTPLLSWEGKYVHVGLNGDEEAIWIAGIGAVPTGEDGMVRYAGVFDGLDADSGRATFDDGTTLAVGEGVDLPDEGAEVVVTFDPRRKVIVDVLGAPSG